METRLLLGLAAALCFAGCQEPEPLVCGGGSVAVDGSCVMRDLGTHDTGVDTEGGTDASMDAPTDAPDGGVPDMPAPVYMINPCLQADGGANENHLHVEVSPGSTIYSGASPVDIVGGTWTEMYAASAMNRVAVATANLADAGPDAAAPGPYWTVTLGAPSGMRLGNETYIGVTGSSPSGPTMDVSYNGVSCSMLMGEFQIVNVNAIADGGYTNLRATFSQSCTGASGDTLQGCIVYSP